MSIEVHAPDGVRVYPSSHDYLAENPGHRSGMDVRGDIGGWDVADGFTLTEAAGRSEWRISVLGNGMIYAVRRRAPNAVKFDFDGPVWVVGELPQPYVSPVLTSSGWAGESTRVIMRQVEKLVPQHDSLLRAVELIHHSLSVLRAARNETLWQKTMQGLDAFDLIDSASGGPAQ